MYYDIPCLCRNPRNLVFKRKVKKQKKKRKEEDEPRRERERERETIRKNETKRGRQIQTRMLHPCQPMCLNVTRISIDRLIVR